MKTPGKAWLALATITLASLTSGCDGPPVESTQKGYRGTGMVQIDSPRLKRISEARNVVPKAEPLAPAGGPRAKSEYKNVPVLGDLSTEEFNRLMLAITEWVSPEQGCAYCHNVENLAADTVPTKIVARRMFQMTAHINLDWKTHVAETGVTCYTCHRGKPVPENIWFQAVDTTSGAYAGNRAGQNAPAPQVGLASLPNDPFTPYLQLAENIRVVGKDAFPIVDAEKPTIQKTEQTYGLMMHMSQSVGLNCTGCHNTQGFANWDSSSPQRASAWYGIRMARDLNVNFLIPLTPHYAANRLGPSGDAPKLNCATCHQGVNKPLNGVSMVKDYPELNKAVK
jgi:photosynthetic reaction center cytochrome c subunit